MTNSALVLFSGGQDSTTCLAWALNRYDHVETLGFDYGQRHAIELTMRPQLLDSLRTMRADWKSKLGEDHLLDLSLLAAISDTALTSDVEITMQENGLPNTFVPGRNLLFLISAAALAYRRGISDLIGGMCETDYSGYPDCRDETLRSLQQAINLGMASKLVIQTPLMWLNKAQSWQLAATLGGQELVELIRAETHTCYLGERGVLYAWGHGCGTCPACDLRARGYTEYLSKK
jgi:7-cyano-7-deazaguanine synthase